MTSTAHRPRTYCGAQVLILLALYLFGGSPDGPSLTDRVTKIVEDDARRDRALQYAAQIEEVLLAKGVDAIQIRTVVITGMREQPLDEVVFRAKVRAQLDDTSAAELRVVDLRCRMRDEMTRDEWAKLFESLRKDGAGFDD